MKKSKSSSLSSHMITADTVEDYFARVPEPHLGLLQKVRTTIRKAAPPGTTETISYGMPTFKYQGALVCIAAFNTHCSLFPIGGAAIEKFRRELKDFQTAKGTIRFTVEKPLPASLITRIVKFRVAQNEARKKR